MRLFLGCVSMAVNTYKLMQHAAVFFVVCENSQFSFFAPYLDIILLYTHIIVPFQTTDTLLKKEQRTHDPDE